MCIFIYHDEILNKQIMGKYSCHHMIDSYLLAKNLLEPLLLTWVTLNPIMDK